MSGLEYPRSTKIKNVNSLEAVGTALIFRSSGTKNPS
jgi:hypothetical protein